MTADSFTLVDCHVHLHPQFDAAHLFDCAADNLQSAAGRLGADTNWSGVLLLTEMSGVDWFGATCERISQGATGIGRWVMSLSPESQTLLARERDGGRKLRIVSGRQIETAERVEVLALMTRSTIADGMPLEETLTACHAAAALVVLPWGVGKWLGERGRIVEQALGKRPSGLSVLAGDNGGRPWFWPRPRVFKRLEAQGLPVLAGTDPLPLADQASRAGSYGMALMSGTDEANVAEVLKARFLSQWNPRELRTFGALERGPRFIINQLRLRS